MNTRPLVLVIDDSDDIRDVFAIVLHLEGFAVEEARDGREGVEKAGESLPDIIIADLRMPVMDRPPAPAALTGRSSPEKITLVAPRR